MKEEIKELIEIAEFKHINYKEHTKYLNEIDLILITDYPKGVKIKEMEIGYSREDGMRIISGKEE